MALTIPRFSRLQFFQVPPTLMNLKYFDDSDAFRLFLYSFQYIIISSFRPLLKTS